MLILTAARTKQSLAFIYVAAATAGKLAGSEHATANACLTIYLAQADVKNLKNLVICAAFRAMAMCGINIAQDPFSAMAEYSSHCNMFENFSPASRIE